MTVAGKDQKWMLKLVGSVIYMCVCIYSHMMEYSSTIKKNEIMPFEARQVDLESITLSEVSQIEKDKYYMISLICGI